MIQRNRFTPSNLKMMQWNVHTPILHLNLYHLEKVQIVSSVTKPFILFGVELCIAKTVEFVFVKNAQVVGVRKWFQKHSISKILQKLLFAKPVTFSTKLLGVP